VAAALTACERCSRLKLGDEQYKTSFKDNAGGKNVVFDEKFSFNKKEGSRILTVKVYDKASWQVLACA
jgi:hypothetical protein